MFVVFLFKSVNENELYVLNGHNSYAVPWYGYVQMLLKLKVSALMSQPLFHFQSTVLEERVKTLSYFTLHTHTCTHTYTKHTQTPGPVYCYMLDCVWIQSLCESEREGETYVEGINGQKPQQMEKGTDTYARQNRDYESKAAVVKC